MADRECSKGEGDSVRRGKLDSAAVTTHRDGRASRERIYMLQRVVCFKYKPEASQQDINAHLEGFKRLPTIVPGIVSYHGGLCVPNVNGDAPPYSSMHCLTFKSMEDMSLYFNHPDHQKFGKLGGAISEKILVVNSEI
jgi:hypothetical protein